MRKLIAVDCENCSMDDIKNMISFDNDSVILFVVGSNQDIKKYRALCTNSMIVKSSYTNKNAADFILALEIMRNALIHNYNTIEIISNDTGFDVVVDRLVELGYDCKRRKCNQKTISFVEESEKQLTKETIENIEQIEQITRSQVKPLCGLIAKKYKSGVEYKKVVNEIRGIDAKVVPKLAFINDANLVIIDAHQRMLFKKDKLIEEARKIV